MNLIKDNGVYFLFNAHGDVVRHRNDDYRYDAFGNELNVDSSDTNAFRYAEDYYDKETKTYYLRARYYDARTGRFWSEDPVKDGLNFYTYCVNDPLKFVDPSGLKPSFDTYDELEAYYEW